MSEENDAERLAAWLENPGSDPPPDLDPEVAGVIYTLSPRRAPAPRVRLDDILASVQEGPFTAPTPRKDQIRTLATPPEKAAIARSSSRRLPRWTLPVATIGAALAALAIIFPTSLNLQKDAQEPILAPMPEMAATAPARQAKTADTAPPPMVPEAKAVAAKEAAPPAAAPAMAPAMAPVAAPAASPPPLPTQSVASGGAMTDNEGSKSDISQSKAPAGFAASEAPPPTEVVNAQKTTVDMPQAEPASAPAMDETQAVREEEGAEMDDMVIAEAASKSKKESERNLRPPAAPAARAPTAADSNANVVWPLDYSANWYSSYADIVPAYTAALSLEQQGQWAQAAVAWRVLMRDARSNVAQDAAFRCANAWWQDGQVATALSVVDEGLRRSSANTAFRARLFALKSQLLDAQGRSKEAEAARKEAIQLNLGR